jgi:hypothetical protein
MKKLAMGRRKVAPAVGVVCAFASRVLVFLGAGAACVDNETPLTRSAEASFEETGALDDSQSLEAGESNCAECEPLAVPPNDFQTLPAPRHVTDEPVAETTTKTLPQRWVSYFELSPKTQIFIRGKVEALSARIGKPHPAEAETVLTDMTVQVQEIYCGIVPDRIVVTYRGGLLDGIPSRTTAMQRDLEVGGEYVLMLSSTADINYLMAGDLSAARPPDSQATDRRYEFSNVDIDLLRSACHD